MLVVRVFGGLGNQMFQYAFYEFLKKNNKDVMLDTSDFNIHNHHQGYELERVFAIEKQNVENMNMKKCIKIKNNILTRLFGKLGKNISSKEEFLELQYNCRILDKPINKDIYFNGFWQDLFYINNISKILKEKFSFREIIDDKNIFFANECKKRTIISIHVRRGDYLKDKNFASICNHKYYNKAIKLMKDKYPDAAFAFFSDDLDWCRKNLKHSSKDIFVDWNTGENSFRDMQLMSLCKHNIIANSTFSWWGAWLNSNSDKTVIIPKQWSVYEMSDLICDKNWIAL